MPVRGPLSHIDLSIRNPRASIPFYGAFFEALGWHRFETDNPNIFVGMYQFWVKPRGAPAAD